MNVYVESNFVVELGLEQEDSESCAEIMRLAFAKKIKLVIPAFSLAEPHQAIVGKAKARAQLASELRTHLRELGRSKPNREIPASFDTVAATLIANAQFEREGIRRAVAEILSVAEVIALDSIILRTATAMESTYRLSGQDAIVLASVLSHLAGDHTSESCFVNRNTKDFDEPDIRESLEALQCKFFGRFFSGVEYLKSSL